MKPEMWCIVIILSMMPFTLILLLIVSVFEKQEWYKALKCYAFLSLVIDIISVIILRRCRPIDILQPIDLAIVAVAYACSVCTIFSFVSLWRIRRWRKKRHSQGE